MRVATPFKNLTREWLDSRGITQYEIVDSQSSTELCPWNGKSDVISDLVSTGTTLKQNNLKKLDTICKSSAALFVSKNSLKKQNVRKILKLLSK